MYCVGIGVYCAFPAEGYHRKKFFDENALLTGLVKREFKNATLIATLQSQYRQNLERYYGVKNVFQLHVSHVFQQSTFRNSLCTLYISTHIINVHVHFTYIIVHCFLLNILCPNAFDVHISLAHYTIGSMACWLTVDWKCIHSTILVIASLGHVTVPMEPTHMLY